MTERKSCRSVMSWLALLDGLLLLVAPLRSGKAQSAPPPTATDSHSRTCGAGSPPEISLRQVGEFPLDSTLSVLKRRYSDHWSRAAWPVSEDSAVKAFKAGVDPGHYAGIKFQLGCFELEGTQVTESLDDQAPIRVWGVMGVGGVLPRDVPLDATWAELRAA